MIDASGGEKLEQWGPYRLIRPDPQVIWNTPKGAEWKHVNAHYHRSSKGGGSWDFFDLMLNEIQVIGTPGEGFGACGEGFFRLSSFGNPEETKIAAERIRHLVDSK